MKRILLTSAAALFVAGAALAAEPPVQSIDVSTDLSAIKNPAAAEYFANLDTDLENEIAARLAPDQLVDSDGTKIRIDINAVELASTWANLNDISQSKLTGNVHLVADPDGIKTRDYTLSVAYPDVVAVLPEGTNIAALTGDSKAYYDAMLVTFADYVVDHLEF